MCGRYQLVLPLEALQDLFDFVNEVEPFPPRYNIAPTQPIHVVHTGPRGRALTLMRWGLLPSWVKDPKAFPLIINARSETAVEKPAFRNAIRRRRALIPATGFYEWRREGTRKQPFFFEPGNPIAFAGVFETWSGPDGEELDTAAILTAAATGVPAQYHDRMPLTVAPEHFEAWLDPANEDGSAALGLADRQPYSVQPVSMRLSNARNEGAALMTPDPEKPPAPPRKTAKARKDDETPRLL